jgi:hypothetical protein
MHRVTVVLVVAVAAVCISCSSSEDPAPQANEPSETEAEPTSASPSPTPALVGRWERVTTCEELVEALDQAGLGATAAAMLAGNGLVPGSPKQLAQKADICQGAVSREHSHFFTASGQFGSVDYNDEQVDDGPYEILDDDTVRIGETDFRFRITDGGQTLALEPVIEPSAKREALEQPLEFSGAGWSVAVAFPGHTWERVDCDGWC